MQQTNDSEEGGGINSAQGGGGGAGVVYSGLLCNLVTAIIVELLTSGKIDFANVSILAVDKVHAFLTPSV